MKRNSKDESDVIDSKLGDREEEYDIFSSDDEDSSDAEDEDDDHPDVDIENQLERINNCVAVIMLDDDVNNVDDLKAAITEFEMVVAEDSRIRNGSYIRRDVVRRLIHLLDSKFYPLEERWELQVNAVLILRNLENWDTVPRKDSFPGLDYLLHSEYSDIIEEVLKMLTKFASYRSISALEWCTEDFFEDVSFFFEDVSLKGHPQLIRMKAEFALAVSIHHNPINSWASLFTYEMTDILNNEDFEVASLACAALFNFTIESAHIPLICMQYAPYYDSTLSQHLIKIIDECKSVHVARLALKVLGNVARWGHDYYNRDMINGGLLECILPLLKGDDRKAQNEACWIISNVTAASKLEGSGIWNIITCLSSLLEKHDSERELKMNAAWTIFNFFIGLVDYEQIRWPRRTVKDTRGKQQSFSTFRPVDP